MNELESNKRLILARGLFTRALQISGQQFLPYEDDSVIDVLGNGTLMAFKKHLGLRANYSCHLGDQYYPQVLYRHFVQYLHNEIGKDRIVGGIAKLIEPHISHSWGESSCDCEVLRLVSYPNYAWYSEGSRVAELDVNKAMNFREDMKREFSSGNELDLTERIATGMSVILKEDIDELKKGFHPIPDFP